MSRKGLHRRLADKTPIGSPFEDEKNRPNEEKLRYGNRVLKFIPKSRVFCTERSKLVPVGKISVYRRAFIVADVLLHVALRKPDLHFKPLTAPEFREMIAIMHGVNFSVATVRREFPTKKGIVSDWRDLRLERMSRRSHAKSIWVREEPDGIERAYMKQAVVIRSTPSESDFDPFGTDAE